MNRMSCRHGVAEYLVFGGIVALGEVSIDLSVVQQAIVNQVPAPALVVAAQQSHVALALHGGTLGGDADHCHGAQGPLPPHLPGVPALREANLGARAIRALGDGVAVESEAVLLHVHVPRTVVGTQSVLGRLELAGESRGHKTPQYSVNRSQDTGHMTPTWYL